MFLNSLEKISNLRNVRQKYSEIIFKSCCPNMKQKFLQLKETNGVLKILERERENRLNDAICLINSGSNI